MVIEIETKPIRVVLLSPRSRNARNHAQIQYTLDYERQHNATYDKQMIVCTVQGEPSISFSNSGYLTVVQQAQDYELSARN